MIHPSGIPVTASAPRVRSTSTECDSGDVAGPMQPGGDFFSGSEVSHGGKRTGLEYMFSVKCEFHFTFKLSINQIRSEGSLHNQIKGDSQTLLHSCYPSTL